jgi:hypothetical protein
VGFVWQKQDGQVARAQDAPAQVEQPAPLKKLTSPVKISFDLQKLQKDSVSVFTACAIPPPSEGALAPWKEWVAFEGKRLRVSSSETDVPAFAVRTPEGAALCVRNHTDGPAEVRVNASLPHGVYTIERLVVNPAVSPPALGIERLPGVLLENDGFVRKGGSVPAGGIAVYRWVNRSQQTLTAFRGVKQRIKALRAKNGGQYRWLTVPFGECESNIAVISRGISTKNRYGILKHVHRAILTAAHTEALCRNFTDEARIDKKAGDALGEKLDLLDEALSELSVACLGLSPETRVEPVGESGACKVTVSVTNLGSETISFVKIGALGGGALKVSPEELATFGSVRPGETARAVYTVRCSRPEDLCGVSAHLGYLAGKSPVHLRLRPAV